MTINTSAQQEAQDRQEGMAEVCTTCGATHWVKSPQCASCWEAEAMVSDWVTEYESRFADEPVAYEVA